LAVILKEAQYYTSPSLIIYKLIIGVFLGSSLSSRGFDVTVFEKSSKFSRFGGPIQLASNALSCINSMSPELFERIMGRFTFTGTRKCGIKDGMRN
jgi:zeaxanthin epoxidase